MSSVFNSVWFSMFPDVSFRTKVLLLEHFGDVDGIFSADEKSLTQVPGINRREAALFAVHDTEAVNKVIDACNRDKIRIITQEDLLYPSSLLNMYFPPTVLYVRGTLPPDHSPQIAVIGTRKATDYGIRMGTKIGYEITRCGGIVVSGLTAGVDAAGAKGALMAGGPCVGVLGTSHDLEKGKLAQSVEQNGAVISEYAPGTQLNRGHFRARNRITAGLSLGTVVVEAPEKSGTRLFVNEAVEQGKDIFAVPGNADSPNSAGIIDFLRDGAKPVFDGWDVMSEYAAGFSFVAKPDNFSYPEASDKKRQNVRTDAKNTLNRSASRIQNVSKTENTADVFDLRNHPELFTTEQYAVIRCFSEGAMTVDDIVFSSQLPARKVLSLLTVLEIKKFVKRENGNLFILNKEYK